MAGKGTAWMLQELTRKSSEHSQELLPECSAEKMDVLPHTGIQSVGSSESVDSLQNSLKEQWCDISDFSSHQEISIQTGKYNWKMLILRIP